MASQSPETRCKVHLRYKQLYDKELTDVIKSECGKRAFGQVLQFLATDPLTAECMMINKACSGIGTKEFLLTTILCGRTNKEMEMLKKKYFDLYSKDLGRVLDSEMGGDLEKLVFNVLQASEEDYDPEFHTEDKMKEDVKKLHEAGLGSFGTDEVNLFKILCASPSEYLKGLNLAYADKYGYTLTKACEKELKRDAEAAALFMLGMKLKPYEEVAKVINRACKGLGTDELLLSTILIRYQLIMSEVQKAHEELYGKSILERVKSETRGDYEKVLVALLETVYA